MTYTNSVDAAWRYQPVGVVVCHHAFGTGVRCQRLPDCIDRSGPFLLGCGREEIGHNSHAG
jgi:hypothetical protein